MHIRHEVLIDDLGIDADSDFDTTLTLPDNYGSNVELLLISNFDEQSQEDLPSLLLRQDISIEIASDMFLGLTKSLHDWIPADYTSQQRPYPAARILKSRRIFDLETRDFRKQFPEWIDLQRQFEAELTSNALAIVNLIRWRFGIFERRSIADNRILLVRGQHEDWAVAYSTRDDFWNHLWPSNAAVLNRETSLETQGMLAQGKKEPLARDLLREAYEHRQSNSRSSLIVGIAAAEVGLKRYFTRHLPRWSDPLIIEAQQLPVRKLMREVLPVLLEQSHSFKSPQLPKSTVISPIHEGSEYRNIAVHQPPDSTKSMDLNNYLANQKYLTALRGVSDLLYFLDYFSGEEWAINNVSKKSREDWFSRNHSS